MHHGYTVLIIEDDPDFRLTLGAYLEDSGYRVIEAEDGKEGIEVFAREKPDIVLTDLRMPKLDGLGVITAIRRESPGTPVIVVTGTGEPLMEKESVRLGARDCFLKPINDLMLLEAAMEKAIEV